MIEIISCGTVCETLIGGIKGQITAACIRFGSVQYEFTYVDGGNIKTEWMREGQLSFAGPDGYEKQKIGYART